MKRFILGLLSVLILVSCLSGGENVSSGSSIGVLTVDEKSGKSILSTPYGPLYSGIFADESLGTCWYVQYTIDFGIPENSSPLLGTNGYYTATVTAKEELPRYEISGVLVDTSLALPNETAVISGVSGILGSVNGIWFLTHSLSASADQRTAWSLSYAGSDMWREESGRHIYNIYLRATIRLAGEKSPERTEVACAYAVQSFMESAATREKSVGSASFYVRFNYVTSIDEDGKLVWAYHDEEILVSNVLPE
jgi:hypothetical protein